MTGYEFDLMTKAESTSGSDKSALQAALLARPFQLFYASEKQAIEGYVADPRLRNAVNVALATGRPLLLTGEPGTGKTSAATWIAGQLGLDLLRFQVKSTSRAQDLLYGFNAVEYFREAQIAAVAGAPAPNKAMFVEEGPFWTALKAEQRPTVLLLDEIDKAPRDFPNDLLFELDRMEIVCPERKQERIQVKEAGLRPIVVITSNSERRLPEPFLRRCIYHHIVLDEAAFQQILDTRMSQVGPYFKSSPEFRNAAQACFFKLRKIEGLQKKPATDEFWTWFVLTRNHANAELQATELLLNSIVGGNEPLSKLPFLSTLLKLNEDIERVP